MGRFRDEYAPAGMASIGWVSSPEWSTQITRVDSGAEGANQRWADPLRKFSSPEGIRSMAVFEDIKDQWLVMGGPAHTWPLRDPTDFASVRLHCMGEVPDLTGLDQAVGAGDGITTEFRLLKTYTRGAFSYVREIQLPIVSTVIVLVDGVDPATLPIPLAHTVSRYGGVVTFTPAPLAGAVITAGFLFDIEVRFEDDNVFAGIVKSITVAGYHDISLVEVRMCEDE